MKDLTGQRFGRLIAVRPTEQRRSSSVVWECICDCGNTAFTASADLCNGKTKSCGCIKKETAARNGAGNIDNEKELLGKRFGRLTVVGRSEKRYHAAALWECRCDCGNTTFLIAHKIKSGKAKSCGCLRREYLDSRGKARQIDLSGKRFGRLVALHPTEERRHGTVVWECICDCGNTAFVSSVALNSGDTRSCGCLRKDHAQRVGNDAAGPGQ